MTNVLKPNEIQILKLLFDDLTIKHTIHSLSKELSQDYAQTYRIIKGLEKKQLISLKKIGNLNYIALDWSKFHEEYIITEISRTKEAPPIIQKIISKLTIFQENICVILFGSYSNNTQSKDSDIDLLIISENSQIEMKIKNQLSLYNCDYNFAKSDNLLDMWSSSKLNVGNEILKKHKVLIGYDQFVKLLFHKYNK